MALDENQSRNASQDESKGGANDSDKDGKGGQANAPRSKKPLIIIAIIVLAIGIISFFIWFAHRNQVSTDDAYTDGNTITMVPKVSGYVVDLYVNDNTHVRKGDLLLRIDARDYVTAVDQARAQLALAQAQLNTARNALRIARVQYPAQLQAASAQQRAAAAQFELAK